LSIFFLKKNKKTFSKKLRKKVKPKIKKSLALFFLGAKARHLPNFLGNDFRNCLKEALPTHRQKSKKVKVHTFASAVQDSLALWPRTTLRKRCTIDQ